VALRPLVGAVGVGARDGPLGMKVGRGEGGLKEGDGVGAFVGKGVGTGEGADASTRCFSSWL